MLSFLRARGVIVESGGGKSGDRQAWRMLWSSLANASRGGGENPMLPAEEPERVGGFSDSACHEGGDGPLNSRRGSSRMALKA